VALDMAARGGRTEPTGIVLESTGVVLAPTEIVSKPTCAVLQPTGVALKPTGDVLEPTGIALKLTGAVLEPTGAVLEPTGIVLEPTDAVLEAQNLTRMLFCMCRLCPHVMVFWNGEPSTMHSAGKYAVQKRKLSSTRHTTLNCEWKPLSFAR
jgi:hypothetical protein